MEGVNRKIKIGYYIGDIDLQSGGIAPYAFRVLRALETDRNQQSLEISVIGTKRAAECSKTTLPFIEVPQRWPIVTRVVQRLELAKEMLVRPSEHFDSFLLRRRLEKWFNTLSIDLLHVPFQVPPVFEINVPVVVTMHDVQELIFPEYFSPSVRAWRADNYLRSLRNASKTVVSFNHVKSDLIKYFQLNNDDVDVIDLPYNHCTLEKPTEKEHGEFNEKYGQRGFYLYPAATWPHKNHVLLLKGFSKFVRESHNGNALRLICTGNHTTDHFQNILQCIRDEKLDGHVFFTGIVSEQELYWLYENTKAVVIPSLYEAGSFPLIEAMNMNCAVVCANTTSLPHTMDDNDFIFDARSLDSISEVFRRLSYDEQFAKRSKANSERRRIELGTVSIRPQYESLWTSLIESSTKKRPTQQLAGKI